MTRNTKRETRNSGSREFRADIGLLTDDRVRQFSKKVFGSKYRLEVACAIAGMTGEIFYSREIARHLEVTDSLVHPEVRHLREAGLVEALPEVEGQQIRYLRRNSSVFWDLVLRLSAELITASADEVSESRA